MLTLACSPVHSPGENLPPRIDTGGLLLVEGDSWVTVPVAAYDCDGEPLSFHWQQLGGPAVSLGDTRQPWLKFFAPEVAQRTFVRFELTVTDTRGASSRAARCVLLLPKNDAALNVQAQPPPASLEAETACRLQLLADRQ